MLIAACCRLVRRSIIISRIVSFLLFLFFLISSRLSVCFFRASPAFLIAERLLSAVSSIIMSDHETGFKTSFGGFDVTPSSAFPLPPPQVRAVFPRVNFLLTSCFQMPISKRTAVPLIKLGRPYCRRCIKRIARWGDARGQCAFLSGALAKCSYYGDKKSNHPCLPMRILAFSVLSADCVNPGLCSSCFPLRYPVSSIQCLSCRSRRESQVLYREVPEFTF
jgi:hypothetical protein